MPKLTREEVAAKWLGQALLFGWRTVHGTIPRDWPRTMLRELDAAKPAKKVRHV